MRLWGHKARTQGRGYPASLPSSIGILHLLPRDAGGVSHKQGAGGKPYLGKPSYTVSVSKSGPHVIA